MNARHPAALVVCLASWGSISVAGCSAASDAAPPADAVSESTTADLRIASSLRLSSRAVAAGQTLSGTMTYVNKSPHAVKIQAAAIAARPPGGTHGGGPYDDLQPYAPATTVPAGGTLVVQASRTFTSADPEGAWDVYPTYQSHDGAWHDGPDTYVTVGAGASDAGSPGDGGAPLIAPPLVGATPGTWQMGDLQAAGMTMHYNFLLPYGYDASHSYPVLMWLHENDMGDPYYQGGDPMGLASYVDGWFNTSAFRTSYPCIVVLPYANQLSDPSGETSNFGGWVPPGDHGPNEDAAVAVVQHVVASFSSYPRKVYVTGASLGGIGSWAMMLDYNAINGAFGKVFAAGMPLAGVIERYGFGVNPPQGVVDQMRSVPVFAVHGAGDTTSQPNWDRAMWQDYGGGAFPGDPGAGAPGGAFHYLEDPGLGHDVWDTYSPLPAGKPTYDWLFAQTAP